MLFKWKNVRIFILLTTVILGVSSVFIYLNLNRATPDEPGNIGLFPLESPMSGQEVSLEQAQASVPFKIRLPVNVGAFTELKLSKETGLITVVYAADKPSDSSSLTDVINQNGIVLFEAPISEAYGTLEFADNNFRAIIEETKDYPNGGNIQPVTINGYFGCAGGNIQHCVSWATETTYYRLTTNINYPMEQLVKTALSIPAS
jgi:hypothetical protein